MKSSFELDGTILDDSPPRILIPEIVLLGIPLVTLPTSPDGKIYAVVDTVAAFAPCLIKCPLFEDLDLLFNPLREQSLYRPHVRFSLHLPRLEHGLRALYHIYISLQV
jgi:hypothetical protein